MAVPSERRLYRCGQQSRPISRRQPAPGLRPTRNSCGASDSDGQDVPWEVGQPLDRVPTSVEEHQVLDSHARNPIAVDARLHAEAVSYTHLRAHETVLDLVC